MVLSKTAIRDGMSICESVVAVEEIERGAMGS